MIREAERHHSGGMLPSLLQGVKRPFWNSEMLPSRRSARSAEMRVLSLATMLSDWTKPSRKSSVSVMRSPRLMSPLGSFSVTLPAAVSVLAPWSYVTSSAVRM